MTMKLSVCTLVVCLIAAVWSNPLKPISPKVDVPRLPTNVVPSHYDLVLVTKIENFKPGDESTFIFGGQVKITLQAKDDNVKSITLHAAESLLISEKPALTLDGVAVALTANSPVRNGDQITLTLDADAALTKDKDYELTIIYTGHHSEEMAGFYRSSYAVKDEPDRWILTTQFEQMDARRAFPCFDEPSFKATYSITVKITETMYHNGYNVLSNTQLASDPVQEGTAPDPVYYVYTFDESPVPISSYLVAFIVSDFKESPPAEFGADGKKKPFLTWGQEAYGDAEREVSQTNGAEVMTWYQNYLGVDFPYPKVDQVGIPDFEAGAMENWGLTTYRERLVFHNKETGSVSTMQQNIGVTSHELAHQWFGDLVTLSWWDNIWLNEGFATYFEYTATGQLTAGKDWKMEGQMLVDELLSLAFETDGSDTVRALFDPTTDPAKIQANFDNIAYAKGGSVIRMFKYVFGEEIFKAALTEYLKTNTGKVTSHADLMAAFDKVIPSDSKPAFGTAKDFMTKWIEQPGVPLLTVKKSEDDAKVFTVSQARFLWVKPGAAVSERWRIPLSYTTNLDDNSNNPPTAPTMYLSEEPDKDATFTPNKDNDPEWVLLNNQATGYYRVNYEKENWENLAHELEQEDPKIHEYNRAQLIDDAMSLARSTQADYLDYPTAMRVLRSLKNEKEYIPWKAGLNALSFISNKLAYDDETYKSFEVFVRDLVSDKYDELKLVAAAGDNHLTKLLRIQIATWACKYGVEACIQDAQTLYEAELGVTTEAPTTTTTEGGDTSDSSSASKTEKRTAEPWSMGNPKAGTRIPGDVRSIVLSTMVREYSNDSVFETVKALYEPSTKNVDQLIYLSALGASNNTDNLKALMDEVFIAKTMQVKPQDLKAVISYVHNGNQWNVAFFIKYIKDNLNTLKTDSKILSSMIGSVAGRIAKETDRNDFVALTKTIKDDTTIDQSVKDTATEAVQSTENTKAWLTARGDVLGGWFKENFKSGASSLFFSTTVLLMSCLLLLLR